MFHSVKKNVAEDFMHLCYITVGTYLKAVLSYLSSGSQSSSIVP